MAEHSFNAHRTTRDQQRRIAAVTAVGLNALKPMWQIQVSLLRIWANNIEMFARNYEKELETFRSEHQGEVEHEAQQRAA
jgi:hypothetical protein